MAVLIAASALFACAVGIVDGPPSTTTTTDDEPDASADDEELPELDHPTRCRPAVRVEKIELSDGAIVSIPIYESCKRMLHPDLGDPAP